MANHTRIRSRASCSSLAPSFQPWLARRDPPFRVVFTLQVAHSWANDAFLGRQGVLDGVATSAHLLPVLIHGRLDISGPLVTAWELHKRWPGSWLVVIDHEGQSDADMNTQVKRETVIICCRC